MKDQCLSDPNLFPMVEAEHQRQIKKWGIQDHDPFVWLGFLTEEGGELAQAITEYTFRDGLRAHVINEAIQTATLALKIAEMFLAAPDPKPRRIG